MSDSSQLPVEFALENKTIIKTIWQVLTPSLTRRSDTGTYYVAICIWEGRKFYEYYQIYREDEDDLSDESESTREGESRSESSHSLWGLIYSLQRETGWSHNYILWEESWFNLQMKLDDAPRLISSKRKKEIKTDEELEEFLLN